MKGPFTFKSAVFRKNLNLDINWMWCDVYESKESTYTTILFPPKAFLDSCGRTVLHRHQGAKLEIEIQASPHVSILDHRARNTRPMPHVSYGCTAVLCEMVFDFIRDCV